MAEKEASMGCLDEPLSLNKAAFSSKPGQGRINRLKTLTHTLNAPFLWNYESADGNDVVTQRLGIQLPHGGKRPRLHMKRGESPRLSISEMRFYDVRSANSIVTSELARPSAAMPRRRRHDDNNRCISRQESG